VTNARHDESFLIFLMIDYCDTCETVTMDGLSRLHRDLIMMNNANSLIDARNFMLYQRSARGELPLELAFQTLVGNLNAASVNATMNGGVPSSMRSLERMSPAVVGAQQQVAEIPTRATATTSATTTTAGTTTPGTIPVGPFDCGSERPPKVLGAKYQLTPDDIICGRHKLAFNHLGNRRFRALVGDALQKYFAFPRRDQRSKLIQEIISFVESSGGQFLKCSKHGSWLELDATEKRNKVGHALRDTAGSAKLFKKKFHAKESVPPFVPKPQSSVVAPTTTLPPKPPSPKQDQHPIVVSRSRVPQPDQAVMPVLPVLDDAASTFITATRMMAGIPSRHAEETAVQILAMEKKASSGTTHELKHRIFDPIDCESKAASPVAASDDVADGDEGDDEDSYHDDQYADASEDDETVGHTKHPIDLEMLMSLPYFSGNNKAKS
jgi:hypothetical protein